MAHSSACTLCCFLSIFLSVLSRPSFTFRTPNKDQKIEQLFYFLLVQVLQPGDIHELHGNRFCACCLQALTKVPRAKVVHFGSLGWIPMIQVPFNSSCVALQYETGTKFFYRAVSELYGIKNQKISVQPHGIFHIFSRFYRVSDLLTIQE